MSDETPAPLRLLFIGDVIGRAGRAAVVARLPRLREALGLDFVIVNGENAAGGFGITEAICEEFLQAGADCVTLGNHAFDQREALVFIERQPRLLGRQLSPRARRGVAQIFILRREASRCCGQCAGPGVHGLAGRPLRGDRARAWRRPLGIANEPS